MACGYRSFFQGRSLLAQLRLTFLAYAAAYLDVLLCGSQRLARRGARTSAVASTHRHKKNRKLHATGGCNLFGRIMVRLFRDGGGDDRHVISRGDDNCPWPAAAAEGCSERLHRQGARARAVFSSKPAPQIAVARAAREATTR